jgi:hypothetical protein
LSLICHVLDALRARPSPWPLSDQRRSPQHTDRVARWSCFDVERPPSPDEGAKFRAALAAAPLALIEALEEAERLDRLVE